jgi:hypothetical protein
MPRWKLEIKEEMEENGYTSREFGKKHGETDN